MANDNNGWIDLCCKMQCLECVIYFMCNAFWYILVVLWSMRNVLVNLVQWEKLHAHMLLCFIQHKTPHGPSMCYAVSMCEPKNGGPIMDQYRMQPHWHYFWDNFTSFYTKHGSLKLNQNQTHTMVSIYRLIFNPSIVSRAHPFQTFSHHVTLLLQCRQLCLWHFTLCIGISTILQMNRT